MAKATMLVVEAFAREVEVEDANSPRQLMSISINFVTMPAALFSFLENQESISPCLMYGNLL